MSGWGDTLRFVVWLLSLALYLLFAGEISGSELIAGAAAAVFAAWAAGHTTEPHRFRLSPIGAMAAIGQAFGAIPRDTVNVGAALLGALVRRSGTGRGFLARECIAESGDDSERTAQRGLAVLGRSLAPNGYAVATWPGALVLHRLVGGNRESKRA